MSRSANHDTRDLIGRLKKSGVNMSETQRIASDLLRGKVIVLTGKLEQSTREQAKKTIMERGGKCVSSISKSTSVLAAGSKPSAKKQQKAEELDIPVIDEQGLQYLLETGRLPIPD